MERYDSIIRTYGKENFDKIQNAKLLIVGAGGIGCEVSFLLCNQHAGLRSLLSSMFYFYAIDFEEPGFDWVQVYRAH